MHHEAHECISRHVHVHLGKVEDSAHEFDFLVQALYVGYESLDVVVLHAWEFEGLLNAEESRICIENRIMRFTRCRETDSQIVG